MTERRPLVSVVVPARNEAADIEDCLRSVATQDYPLDRIEVIVVDGASSDGTPTIAEGALSSAGFARAVVMSNAAVTTPSNLNRGLSEATGEFLCRVDARSRIPPRYVTTCIDVLSRSPEVSVVGGAQVAVPPRDDAVGVGIARALNNRWATGFSRYRRGASSGPSDTVYLGAFRTSDLRAIGGWNTDLPTNQDYDLNRRLNRRGIVWFESSLDVDYVPRRTLADLARQYARFGRAKVTYWRLTGDRPRPRQLGLILGVAAMAIASAGTLLGGSRRRRAWAITAAMAALGVVEVVGSDEPRCGWPGHAVGVAALATVGISWVGGMTHGLIDAGPSIATPAGDPSNIATPDS